nr:hypothetical protein HmN_000972000 [Hymenolepis microstoma]
MLCHDNVMLTSTLRLDQFPYYHIQLHHYHHHQHHLPTNPTPPTATPTPPTIPAPSTALMQQTQHLLHSPIKHIKINLGVTIEDGSQTQTNECLKLYTN